MLAKRIIWLEIEPGKASYFKERENLGNFNASMLYNFSFDLTDGFKIQKLAVNAYCDNNVVMVILLKTRIEYPFTHSLSQTNCQLSLN